MQDESNNESEPERSAGRGGAGDRMLRRALRVLGGPALRLHHFRIIHSKMLNQALCARDRAACMPLGNADDDCVR